MSLEQTNVVDFIGIDPDTENAVLTLVDPLPWALDDKDHLLALQEKINSYLSFVESGEILKAYPKAKDREVTIKVVFKHEPNNTALQFLKRARQTIQAAGMELLFETFGD